MVLAVAFAVSCSSEKRELTQLSDSLLAEYSIELDYSVCTEGNDEIKGEAMISRKDGEITVSILSPQPYDGICARYSTQEIPDAIEISYEGLTVDLPKQALEKINVAMAMFTDDFALTLLRLPPETVKSHPDSELHSVEFNYNGSQLSVKYDLDKCFVESFTISRADTTINGAVTRHKIKQ